MGPQPRRRQLPGHARDRRVPRGHPSLRPAPMADLASAYRLAWRWLHDNYDGNRHMLSVFAPGRGNYAYITKEREWQQNVGFFGKALMAARRADARAGGGEGRVVSRAAGAAGSGALRVLPPRRPSGGRVGGAPGPVVVCAADHDGHEAGRGGLPSGAARACRIRGAGRTDWSRPARRTSRWRMARTIAATDGADAIVAGSDGRSLASRGAGSRSSAARPASWSSRASSCRWRAASRARRSSGPRR